MLVKTPEFWAKKTLVSLLLLPLSGLYYLASQLNKFITRTEKVQVPIICVGNITAGGAGKTPVAIAIAQILQQHKQKVAFITRGYGGKMSGPTRVSSIHTASDVGDEPLLLAKLAPCYIAKNRILAAKLAISEGAEILIMDDGLQNYSLHKDLKILVLNNLQAMGNSYLLPAGPLRETLSNALEHVDLVVSLNEEQDEIDINLPDHIPYIKGKVVPGGNNLQGEKIIAFAGIAYPSKFFTTLRALGAEIVEEITYPDHYQYKSHDIVQMQELAKRKSAKLVTTEKDAIKIKPGLLKDTIVLPINVKWDNLEKLQQSLLKIIANEKN